MSGERVVRLVMALAATWIGLLCVIVTVVDVRGRWWRWVDAAVTVTWNALIWPGLALVVVLLWGSVLT